MSVYLCITIDCECDKGPGWRTRKPLSFRGIVHGIGDRLQPLFRYFRATPTYLLSPEVMRDPQSVETLSALDCEADLGTHLHGEFAEPGAFEPDVTRVFQCHYDRETERQKLQYLTNLYREALGHAPRTFRAGRFGIGQNSLRTLQELGYTVDSSVTPYMDWTRSGAPEASFRHAPTQPYWPVPDDPGRAASHRGALLEVPVTIRPSPFARMAFMDRWAPPRWLRPTHGSVGRLVATARDEIKHARSLRRPIVLNCMFHNVEIVPGLSPYAQTEAAAQAILKRLAGLITFAEREGIRTIGLSAIPELFADTIPYTAAAMRQSPAE
jgi:hypothetical protein